jgi:hypothetical protein
MNGPSLGGMGLQPEGFSKLVAPGSGLIGPNLLEAIAAQPWPSMSCNAHDPFHHRPDFPVRPQAACALGPDDLESPRRSAARRPARAPPTTIQRP